MGIAVGYKFEETIIDKKNTGTIFPLTGEYRADVKSSDGGAVLMTLTTANGNFTVSTVDTLDVSIDAADTALLEPYVDSSVIWDIVKTDGADDCYLNLKLTTQVVKPITEPIP